MSAPTLRWLHIHQYERFESVRIEFSSRENLLLGVNGAGKTRLLKLLRAVLSLDFSELLGRAFDIEFEFHAGAERSFQRDEVIVTGRVVNRREVGVGAAEPVTLEPGNELVASITHRRGTVSILCEVRGSEMTYHAQDGTNATERALLPRAGSLRPNSREIRDPAVKTAARKVYFRPGAAYLGESDYEFRALAQDVPFTVQATSSVNISFTEGSLQGLGPLLLWELVPVVMAVGLRSSEDELKLGVGLVDLLARGQNNDLDSIGGLTNALRVREIRVAPKVVRTHEREIECRGVEIRVGFFDGTEVVESELTFGQRRYLYAGIVSALHPGAPVLVDELDNGMHPDLIGTLLSLWQNRQLFIVSHNKLVVDHTNFTGPEDVQAKVHIIRRDRDGRQSVVKLDEAAAREVYEKIAVAIQSPSEVLRAEGLW